MNPIIRNLISVVRRFKLTVILNIIGLSIAFTAFMIILFQLNYDQNFDKHYKDYDRIFRVEYIRNGSAQANLCRPLADRFIESSPNVLAGGIAQMRQTTTRFHLQDDEGRNMFEENSVMVSAAFFDVFSFDFVEGSNEGFIDIESGNIFIPVSMSRKLFGNEPAVGKQIVRDGGGGVRTIKAVYRDFPANSTVGNCMYLAMIAEAFMNDWSEWSFMTYIRLNDAANAPLFFDNFKRNYDGSISMFGAELNWDETGVPFRLTPMADLHYIKSVEYDFTPKANKQTLMILFAIAIVIIAIAFINFTNFSAALTPVRIKCINIQKILGAGRNTLRTAIASEAPIVSFLSFLIAVLLVLCFRATPLANLVDADLSITAQPFIIGATALIALIAGTIAGIFPAHYMTSFSPALTLKGNFGLSPKGKFMRNALISIQFIASLALFIGASFIYLQNYFMQNSPLGYDKDELITVDVGRIHPNRDAFINQLKTYSGIDDVTFGESLLSSSDQYMGWGLSYKGEGIQFQSIPVHYTFLKVLGIEITEGRDFRAEDHNLQSGVYVFNEAARQKYTMEPGTRIEGGIFTGEIIGFVPDIKFASFRHAVTPMAFYVWGTDYWGGGDRASTLYIRVKAGADKRTAMAYVRSTLADFNSEITFNVRFYDEIL
jgi:putative ABC transport system permease protein